MQRLKDMSKLAVELREWTIVARCLNGRQQVDAEFARNAQAHDDTDLVSGEAAENFRMVVFLTNFADCSVDYVC